MVMMTISGGVDFCNGGGQWHSDILLLGKVLNAHNHDHCHHLNDEDDNDHDDDDSHGQGWRGGLPW